MPPEFCGKRVLKTLYTLIIPPGKITKTWTLSSCYLISEGVMQVVEGEKSPTVLPRFSAMRYNNDWPRKIHPWLQQ